MYQIEEGLLTVSVAGIYEGEGVISLTFDQQLSDILLRGMRNKDAAAFGRWIEGTEKSLQQYASLYTAIRREAMHDPKTSAIIDGLLESCLDLLGKQMINIECIVDQQVK